MKISTAFAATAFLSPAAALAQVPTLPTNAPGVRIVAPPPAGFNALAASAQDRAKYAIPPAPDAAADPAAFAEWQRAVGAPRAASGPAAIPTVSQTNISNGPVKLAKAPSGAAVANSLSQTQAAAISTYSYNWSGPAFYDSRNKFKTAAIIGEFVVPTARQAFGKCDGTWDYSSSWAGLDGFNSNDVLQAGVEADAYCQGATRNAFYSSWIEWYPFNETRVSSPTISPGDVVFVQVWNVTPTTGYAFFYNFSTQTQVTYQLTAPSGTALVGTSAEWVVERPGVNGSLATLANYLDSSWPYNVAWNYTAPKPEFFYPGKPSGGTTSLYNITMLDNANGPISSEVAENSFDFLFFRNFGSSLGTGSEPLANGVAQK